MKNNISKILMVLIGISVISSCSDYLKTDQYFQDRTSIESTFTNLQYSEEWLANAFSYLGGANADVCNKAFTQHCFADDMYYGDRDASIANNVAADDISYRDFHMGNYDENNGWKHQNDSWGNCYKGIRAATTFIDNIYMNKQMTAQQIADYKAQARFVRAYYYLILLRIYGPIPIIPEHGLDYTQSYEALALPRNTYDECADYIATEMQTAAKDLPLTRDQANIARPTRGAALAARAIALLYAASPLMNGQRNADAGTADYVKKLVDNTGKPLLSLTYNENKYAQAAAACLDVINLNRYSLYVAYSRTNANGFAYPATIMPPDDGNFSKKNWPDGWANIDPFESYRSEFNGTVQASQNPDMIFSRGQNQGTENLQVMVIHQMPSSSYGWNTEGITQKQCDAYYMNDGTNVPGKDSEYGKGDGSQRVMGFTTQDYRNGGEYAPLGPNVSLQYANREPRFYASVAYNGSTWYGLNWLLEASQYQGLANQQVFYYRGSGNGYTNTMFYLRTGIGCCKWVNPNDAGTGGAQGAIDNIIGKDEPAIRYANILLMYAEAVNELTTSHTIQSWDGSASYSIERNLQELQRGVQPIRIRAGLPDFTQTTYANADEFRKALKRERQIELMGEGQRYYDLRRWMDAPVEENMPVYGCNVLMSAQQSDLFHIPVAVATYQVSFTPKMYFWPIPHSELQEDNKLTQNSGWSNYI